jgi:hypothetical protein
MGSFSHAMAPPLLAAALVLVAVKWARRYRAGQPLPLVPRSVAARAVALTVIVLVAIAGSFAGHPWAAVVPAIALGGIAGATVDRLRDGSRTEVPGCGPDGRPSGPQPWRAQPGEEEALTGW